MGYLQTGQAVKQKFQRSVTISQLVQKVGRVESPKGATNQYFSAGSI